ncbi:hypothetical protein [Actinoplanes siamensis]|uniref:Uncharacterized protein n=1 Tax=Actinoplanes siamensis TaxID=1223317 RepID=A0A919N5X6_9ACTN|nr:hypothetical protein [Actinoplanes siamensis]GIF04919.1 hypothetical protein Asi03nite_24570 [Actinoplanes siamensis]
MTNSDVTSARTDVPAASQMMCADSLGRTLLAMAVPPAQRRAGQLQRIPVLGRRGELPEDQRRVLLAAEAVDEAVPLSGIDHVDTEAVASWIVRHFTAGRYPAVVLGSAHGAAVHLAAACDAAWLPTAFTLTAPWPGGDAADWAAAMDWGAALAERILARNPDVTVRQVHDPVARGPLCAATVSLQIRWRALPAAYRDFLTSRAGSIVLVRDLRTWPVRDGPLRYGFQIGSPAGGWTPDDYHTRNPVLQRLLRGIGAGGDWRTPCETAPRQYADTGGEPALDRELRQLTDDFHRVLYTEPQALSAGVADLHRDWSHGRHAVITTGRMIDPWRVVEGRAVPYWCESSSRSVTDAAQLWLAGSRPFDTITVLPEPPGVFQDDTAGLTHWRAVANFARGHGHVDSLIARRYPLLPSAPGHASQRFDGGVPGPQPGPLPAAAAMRRLACGPPGTELLVV